MQTTPTRPRSSIAKPWKMATSMRTTTFAQLLALQERLGEVEGLFRQGVAAGDRLAAKNLALYLIEQGQERAARKALTRATKMGVAPTDDEIEASRAWATANTEPMKGDPRGD